MDRRRRKSREAIPLLIVSFVTMVPFLFLLAIFLILWFGYSTASHDPADYRTVNNAGHTSP
jgi:hypothetical protein